jgi:hypothetical protein
MSPMRVACPAYLIPPDLMTLTDVTSTNYEAHFYAVFSGLLLLLLSLSFKYSQHFVLRHPRCMFLS